MKQSCDNEMIRLRILEERISKERISRERSDHQNEFFDCKSTVNDCKPRVFKKKKEPLGVGIYKSNGSAHGRIVYRRPLGGEYYLSGNSKAYLNEEQKASQVDYFSD